MSSVAPYKNKILVCYSRHDSELKARLDEHLLFQERLGSIELWSEDQVTPGDDQREAFGAALDAANLAVLLLSPAFLASPGIQDLQLPAILSKHRQAELQIVPVLLRHCLWMAHEALNPAAMLPSDLRPIASREPSEQDAAFVAVAQAIQLLHGGLASHKPTAAGTQPTPSAASSMVGPYDPSAYVRRVKEEENALNDLRRPGCPVVLFGPPQCGKTSLLSHLMRTLAAERDTPSHIVGIDLGRLGEDKQRSADDLLPELAQRLVRGFGMPAQIEGIRRRIAASPNSHEGKLARLMEEVPLAHTPGRLVVAIDQADAISDPSVREKFFVMLRSWSQSAHTEPWSKLRLILALTRTPSFVPEGTSSGFFSNCVTRFIPVQEFGESQVEELCRNFGQPFSPDEIQHLMGLLGGHPKLWSLVLQARAQGSSKSELLNPTYLLRSVCGTYFAERWQTLRRLGLVQFLQRLAQGQDVELPPSVRERLIELHLLKMGEWRRKFLVRHGLFEEFARQQQEVA